LSGSVVGAMAMSANDDVMAIISLIVVTVRVMSANMGCGRSIG
jgi:hypothetical protein